MAGTSFHVEFSLETTGNDAHVFAHGSLRDVSCAPVCKAVMIAFTVSDVTAKDIWLRRAHKKGESEKIDMKLLR